MKVISVVGARPNFMKVAPLAKQMSGRENLSHHLVHTGQHYDPLMSEEISRQLNLPIPEVNLNVGSGTHAQQTAKALVGFERVLLDHRPDWVVVVGDVNSTLACALAAAKLKIPVAHVEAGLRSFDRRMSEEINRVLTDALADLLFAPSQEARAQLLKEGISPEKIHVVGNIMIDALQMVEGTVASCGVAQELRISSRGYGVVTLHRAENVDEKEILLRVGSALKKIAGEWPLVFPVHPRTYGRLKEMGLLEGWRGIPRLALTEPLGYVEFLALLKAARFVLTDSGGVQEEAAWLGIPCVTLRDRTEWTETVEAGMNRLAGTDPEKILAAVGQSVGENGLAPARPPLWDGKTAERIVNILLSRG